MDTSTLTSVTVTNVLVWAAIIGIAACIAYLVYRSIDHPRLRLTQTPLGPRVTRRDLILYIVTTPVLITLWWLFFFGVLLVNDNEINPAQLVIFPLALIIAIRTLAFVAPRASHELAKVIPIALVAFVILDGSIRSPEEFVEMVAAVDSLELSWPTLLLIFVYDYILTAIWYVGWIRWGQPRWQARTAHRSTK